MRGFCGGEVFGNTQVDFPRFFIMNGPIMFQPSMLDPEPGMKHEDVREWICTSVGPDRNGSDDGAAEPC
jgi:hypothetical protein